MPDSPYTDPALRDRLKAKILAGDKGGNPGQGKGEQFSSQPERIRVRVAKLIRK